MNHVEDMNHIFSCPALRAEHVKIQDSVEAKLKEWKVLFSDKRFESVEERTCKKWFKVARTTMSKDSKRQNLSHDSLWLLVKGYWSANPNGTSSNLKKFLVHVNLAIMRNSGACPNGQCEMKCFLAVPHNLLTLLVQKLHLQIEGQTNAVHRSPLFQEWCSSDQIDSAFGSRGPIRSQSLAGHNTFILMIDMDRETRMELIALFRTWLSSKKPTRLVIITPRKDVEAWLRPRDRRFLELGFSTDFPFVHSTAHLTKSTLIRSNHETISILLALNKESMALDPIDWHARKK